MPQTNLSDGRPHFAVGSALFDHTSFGCQHFKIDMGRRSPAGTSDDDLKTLADSLNVLGQATADLGVRLSPHPHIWGPVERPEEIHRLMELTDPRYVCLLPDTAHLNLGGGDPLALVDQYYDRVFAIPAWAARTGIPLTGPNCLGLLNAHERMVALPPYWESVPAGAVGMAFQSGMTSGAMTLPIVARGMGSRWR